MWANAHKALPVTPAFLEWRIRGDWDRDRLFCVTGSHAVLWVMWWRCSLMSLAALWVLTECLLLSPSWSERPASPEWQTGFKSRLTVISQQQRGWRSGKFGYTLSLVFYGFCVLLKWLLYFLNSFLFIA